MQLKCNITKNRILRLLIMLIAVIMMGFSLSLLVMTKFGTDPCSSMNYGISGLLHLSFGNYQLDTKSKVSDFEHCGDSYKVKTYNEITKLEKNGSFVYESVPGTAVNHFKATDDSVSFKVEGTEDAQITLELEEGSEYEITIDGESAGKMATNMGGKLVLSVEFEAGKEVSVNVVKA